MRTFAFGMAAALLCSASAAGAQEAPLEWLLRVNEGRVADATLAYAQPETDYQLISLSCERGGARIFATIDHDRPNLRVIGLKSGPQALVVGGKSEYAEEVDMHYFTSREIDAKSPLFDAFAASGTLTVLVSGDETEMKGAARAKAVIARFVRFCRG